MQTPCFFDIMTWQKVIIMNPTIVLVLLLQTPTLKSVSEAASSTSCVIKSAVRSDSFAKYNGRDIQIMAIMIICSYCH